MIGGSPAGSVALALSGRQVMDEHARPSPKLVSCMQLEQGPRGFFNVEHLIFDRPGLLVPGGRTVDEAMLGTALLPLSVVTSRD